MKVCGALFTLGLLSAPAYAADDSRIDKLTREVEQLRQQLNQVESELREARAEAAAEPAEDAPQPKTVAVAPPSTAAPNAGRPIERSARPNNIVTAPIDRAAQNANLLALVQVSASTADKEASFAFTTSISDPGLRGRSTGRAHYQTLTWTAAASLGDDDTTNVATLDGFANGFSLKLKYSNYSVRLRNPGSSVDYLAVRARNACLRKLKDGADESDCDIGGGVSNEFMLSNLSDEDYRYYLNQYFPPSARFLWGLEGGLGYKEFKFFDAATLTKNSAHRWPVSGKIFGTWMPNSGQTSLTLSAEYQRAFEAATTLTYCPTPAGTAPTKCTTGAFGEPDRTTKILLAGEARTFIPLPQNSILPGIGISGQVTYDAKNNDWGLDLPIYFVPDSEGNVIGGVRFGYTTSEKNAIVGVFVGTKFSPSP